MPDNFHVFQGSAARAQRNARGPILDQDHALGVVRSAYLAAERRLAGPAEDHRLLLMALIELASACQCAAEDLGMVRQPEEKGGGA